MMCDLWNGDRWHAESDGHVLAIGDQATGWMMCWRALACHIIDIQF